MASAPTPPKVKEERPKRNAPKPKRYTNDSDSDDSGLEEIDRLYDELEKKNKDDDYEYRLKDDQDVYGVRLKIKPQLAAKPKITKPSHALRQTSTAKPRQPVPSGGIPPPNMPPREQQTAHGGPAIGYRGSSDQEMNYMAQMYAKYGSQGLSQAIRNLGGLA